MGTGHHHFALNVTSYGFSIFLLLRHYLEEDLKEKRIAQVVVGVFKVKLSILTIEYSRDN
jgi:hypothetical protein